VGDELSRPTSPGDPLRGRVAVVTGAGRGRGRSHALLLASLGAAVVVNDPGVAGDGDRDGRPADAIVAEIKAAGRRAVGNLESCASWAGAEALVAQAVETFGSLDIVVNNAGILRDRMSFSMSEQDWDAVMDVNLKGHFAVSRFAAAHWRDRAKRGERVYGRIVNTTSEAGLMGLGRGAHHGPDLPRLRLHRERSRRLARRANHQRARPRVDGRRAQRTGPRAVSRGREHAPAGLGGN
jgi:NAD(P)-dependent dehydrogenase (short-subunit alcohol dehydrogenase family)